MQYLSRGLWLLVPLTFSACVTISVGDLQPRPNLPEVQGAPSAVILLDDSIRQKIDAEGGMRLETYRGDLKRGFLNGFPGAVTGTDAALRLVIARADPSITCFPMVCTASVRFNGRLVHEATDVATFAGTAVSAHCTDPNDCLQSAIERVYEQIFADVKDQLRSQAGTAPRRPLTQL